MTICKVDTNWVSYNSIPLSFTTNYLELAQTPQVKMWGTSRVSGDAHFCLPDYKYEGPENPHLRFNNLL